MSLSGMILLAVSILVECEGFREPGGWKTDTQFADQVGSSYLIAHGLGKPVADARTTFEAPQAGGYDVWVRTKNWTAPWHPGAGAGAFGLVVNGRTLADDLGTRGDGAWRWTRVGRAELKAGENELALRDLDGFDGRCDAVLFTTEPFDERTGLVAGRPARGDDAAREKAAGSYDLCVVGGGIAGICTAVSAARLGLKVALVNDRPVLGGNNSSEVRVHLGAWQNVPPYPRLGDVVAELGPKRGGNAECAANYEDERKMAVVRAEPNISLFLNCRVFAADTAGSTNGAIRSVSGRDVRTGERLRFAARWFADCTGDGTVGVLAGADYRMGRESRAETGEALAPERADAMTMGASVQWRAQKTGRASAFPLRPWMIRLDDGNGRAELKGDWDWETGLGRDQVAEGERIRDYGLLVAYSNWAYAKNVSGRRAEFADAELEWVAHVAGRRESRRLMGDFVLNGTHLMNRELQPDGTCATTWTIDLHFPLGAEETKYAGEPFISSTTFTKIWPYPIPYRCYYSRNVPNLFMAGRDISVTHVALGTTRLMRTHGMMGEVVGMAASICRRHGCDPRDVYARHLDELKALMAKGVGDGRAHPPQMYNLGSSLDTRTLDESRGNHQVR